MSDETRGTLKLTAEMADGTGGTLTIGNLAGPVKIDREAVWSAEHVQASLADEHPIQQAEAWDFTIRFRARPAADGVTFRLVSESAVTAAPND